MTPLRRTSSHQSPVLRDRPKLIDCVLRPLAFLCVNETMIDMIVYERALGTGDGAFNRLELLRKIDAGPLFLDHRDDAAQVACSTVQTLDDSRVTGVSVVRHTAM